MNCKITKTAVFLVLAWLWAAGVQAQGVSRLGTIDEVSQDNNYIVISGTTYPYYDGEVTIRYRDQAVSTTFLTPGLRISYRLNENGNIAEIVLIGPIRLLEQINRH